MAERTPADHHGGRVVAAGGDRGTSFPQRAEPVLGPPAGGVSRVGGDDRQARIGGHLDEPVPEPGGREAGDQRAIAPAALAARGPAVVVLASLFAGIGKIQVLDHDRLAAAFAGQPDDRRDGGAQPPVAL